MTTTDSFEFLPGDIVQNLYTGVMAEVVKMSNGWLVIVDKDGRFAVNPTAYALLRRSS